MQTQCAPADTFALGFTVKCKQNYFVWEGVYVDASKFLGKAEEKINLLFSKSVHGILLLDIKTESHFFFLSCFARLLNIPKICLFFSSVCIAKALANTPAARTKEHVSMRAWSIFEEYIFERAF